MRERAVRWLGVSLVVALILGFVFLSFPTDGKSEIDFSQFYCAAQIIHQGLGHDLYNLAVQLAFQSKVATVHVFFNHLPYEALEFLPFARFSYRTAYFLWVAVSVVALGLSSFWISRNTAAVGALTQATRIPTDAGLMFVLFLTFAPATTCLLLGQTSAVTLLIYSGVFVLMKRGSDFWGGCLLALGLCKFQLVLPFAVILLLRRKWAFVRGFSASGALLLLVSIAITGPGFLLTYPRLLFFDPTYQQVAGFNPVFMPNLRGMLTLVLGNRVPSPMITGAIFIFSIVCLASAASAWNDARLEASFSIAILSTLLVSYHLYNYDLTLLLLPVAILAGDLALRGELQASRMFQAALLILFIPPLHRLLLLNSMYPLMAIPVFLLFLQAMKQSRQPLKLMLVGAYAGKGH